MTTKYTLVQHSGFVVGGDYSFQAAVETRAISTKKELTAVEKAGGLVFESYGEASQAEEQENYPPEVTSLAPRVRGDFSKRKVQGQRVYVPKKEEV